MKHLLSRLENHQVVSRTVLRFRLQTTHIVWIDQIDSIRDFFDLIDGRWPRTM